MSESLTVRVLLFAALRDAVGQGELDVPLAAPASGADLLEALSREHPEVARHRSIIRLAINRRYARGDAPLADGDEVALITPVSGG